MYMQLCFASVEKLTVPDVPAAVCKATWSSLTKPHLPGSPFGLEQGFPASEALKICTRLLLRSQTYSKPSLASLAQCTGLRKNFGLISPRLNSAGQELTPSPTSGPPPFSPITGFCPYAPKCPTYLPVAASTMSTRRFP